MTTTSFPLVTVGIPTYNGAERIPAAIASVINQDYPNIEILISDNCSTDQTEEACRQLAANDSRIKYHRQPENLGIIGNFDYVMRNGSGDYFMWLSDDDELKPGLLSKYAQFLTANEDFSMVCSETNYWKEGKFMHQETGMSFESSSALRRVFNMFRKNEGGAIIYGLMRTACANRLVWRQIIGSDWYIMGGMAFQGKVRQLPFVGMDRDMGGVSENHVKLAKAYGEHPIWGYLPYTRITLGTFSDILYANPVYQDLNIFSRIFLAIAGSLGIIITFIKNWFLSTGGKIMRFLRIRTPSQKMRDAAQPARGFVNSDSPI